MILIISSKYITSVLKEINMKRYYDLNPNSPFFHLMQDTTAEDKLTPEEKERIVWVTSTNLASVDIETEKSTPDERAYIIYAALNNIPSDEIARNLLINELGQDKVDELGI